MVEIDEIRHLLETGIISMPVVEREIVMKIYLDEQTPYRFIRERKLKKKDFAAHHTSALQHLKQHLETKNIIAVKDVF